MITAFETAISTKGAALGAQNRRRQRQNEKTGLRSKS
jgi:hypothetical protein